MGVGITGKKDKIILFFNFFTLRWTPKCNSLKNDPTKIFLKKETKFFGRKITFEKKKYSTDIFKHKNLQKKEKKKPILKNLFKNFVFYKWAPLNFFSQKSITRKAGLFL